jgi:hypothetical protein
MPNFNRNANVVLSFDGLAIYNFNQPNWEFLFLRHLESHVLNVNIAVDSIPSHSFTVAKEHNIVIDAGKAVSTLDDSNMIKYQESGTFDFDPINQSEDIRWMDDYLNGKDQVVTPCSFSDTYDKKDLSYLSIEGKSVLYTKELSGENREFEIWERVGDTKKLLAPHRQIGVVVGLAIEYPEGESIKIKIDGKLGFDFNLPIEAGSEYEIKFDNSCNNNPTCEEISDFQHYYKLFEPTGREIEITPVILKDERDRDVSGTAACKCTHCINFTGSLMSAIQS